MAVSMLQINANFIIYGEWNWIKLTLFIVNVKLCEEIQFIVHENKISKRHKYKYKHNIVVLTKRSTDTLLAYYIQRSSFPFCLLSLNIVGRAVKLFIGSK